MLRIIDVDDQYNWFQVTYSVELKDLWCEHNPEYTTEPNITCNVKKRSDGVPILNFRAELAKELKEVMVVINLSRQSHNFKNSSDSSLKWPLIINSTIISGHYYQSMLSITVKSSKVQSIQ